MKLIADTHTHTLACDHAYSTLYENTQAASEKGLRFLCMTEHTPNMNGAPGILYFSNLGIIPHIQHGVVILKGAEVNIIDNKGSFDLPDRMLNTLDWVIASMHVVTFKPMTSKDHTNAWLSVAENPLVDVIGHCGDGRYPFDEAPVLKAFAKNNKIVEINSHSFSAREGSPENCRRIAQQCAELGIRIVVSSDAHHASYIGQFGNAVQMLKSIHFPQELILNADYDRFLAAAKENAHNSTRAFLETL